MAKKHSNRAALELSDGYWSDAQDYVVRYRLTVESNVRDYWSIKSRRMKAYFDLRFAIETLLKSRICLNTGAGPSRKDLLEELRGLSHDIDKLLQRSGLSLAESLGGALAKCKKTPVRWRYEAEAREARAEDERDYYATVGNDTWMRELQEFAEAEVKALGRELNDYSGIVSAAELWTTSDS